MARIKSGPQGLYYDENDSGPDQGSPEEIAAFKAKQGQQQQQPANSGTIDWSSSPLYKEIAASGSSGDFGNDKAYLGGSPTFNESVGSGAASQLLPGDNVKAWTEQQPSAAPQYQFMEGVDVNKLNDPTHNSPKYVASRILASGGSLADAAKAVGATVLDTDKMRLPTGEVIDTRRDQEGANQLQWLVLGDPNASQGGAAGAPGAASAGGFGTGGPFGAGSYSGSASDLFNEIMGHARQSLDVNRKDPIIANQVNAYDAAQERSNRNYLRQQAEAQGPLSNLNQEARMVAEARGQNTGAFQAQIMQQELTARRNEIMQALQLGAGYLTDQQKMQLQMQLAQMDNALQYARLGQSAYEFDQNDEFRRSPLAGGIAQ